MDDNGFKPITEPHEPVRVIVRRRPLYRRRGYAIPRLTILQGDLVQSLESPSLSVWLED